MFSDALKQFCWYCWKSRPSLFKLSFHYSLPWTFNYFAVSKKIHTVGTIPKSNSKNRYTQHTNTWRNTQIHYRWLM